MKRLHSSAILLVCLLLVSSLGAQEKRGRTFVDDLEQAIVGGPQLSPDGKQILFTIDRADWKQNRRLGHIYRINADGTGQVVWQADTYTPSSGAAPEASVQAYAPGSGAIS